MWGGGKGNGGENGPVETGTACGKRGIAPNGEEQGCGARRTQLHGRQGRNGTQGPAAQGATSCVHTNTGGSCTSVLSSIMSWLPVWFGLCNNSHTCPPVFFGWPGEIRTAACDGWCNRYCLPCARALNRPPNPPADSQQPCPFPLPWAHLGEGQQVEAVEDVPEARRVGEVAAGQVVLALHLCVQGKRTSSVSSSEEHGWGRPKKRFCAGKEAQTLPQVAYCVYDVEAKGPSSQAHSCWNASRLGLSPNADMEIRDNLPL